MLHQNVRRTTANIFNGVVFRCRRASTNVGPPPKPSMKHPTRGGQNLSDRYHRLAKSLRGKGTYQRDITELSEDTATRVSPSNSRARTFMGFVVPEEPKPPASEDCCMSGCAICVYDLYDEALDEYKKAVDTLRASLTALRIPEEQWPHGIQTKEAKPKRKPNTSLSAFEELEARLREKNATRSGVTTAAAVDDLPAPFGRRVYSKKTLMTEARSVYEGLRWILFSNR